MGEKNHDREREYSPNPPHMIGKPDNQPPETPRALLYEYHKQAGSLGYYYDLCPFDRPPGRERER